MNRAGETTDANGEALSGSGSSSARATDADELSRRLAGVQAVSFDLDDTLWHCAPAIMHAEQQAWNWFGEHAPRVTDAHDQSTLLEYRMQFYKAHPEWHADVSLLRKASFEALLLEHGYPAADAERAWEVFYRARSQVVLYDGVHGLLGALGERYRLAAITNGNADLDLIGIAHYFHDIQHASLTNRPKPAAQMFQRSLAAFALPPEALLHVGDNPDTDVGGAHNAGALTVWFNQHRDAWPEGRTAPHFEVGSIAELHTLLLH